MSKLTPKFLGSVQNGKLKLTNSSMFHEHLHSLSGNVEVTVKKHTAQKSRSNKQNKFYFKLMEILGDHFGNTAYDMHHTCKNNLLPMVFPEKCKFFNDIAVSVPSTTELNTEEMNKYWEFIQMAFAKEVYLPDPE